MTSLRHLRSSTADKRPDPTAMVDGQLAMNYDIASPGLFFKDDNGTLIKVGPVHVGTTAPNVSPAAGGTAGNSIGEQWLDTTSGVYVLKVWDGSAWRSESGTFVDVSGDTMTGALTMANQQAVRFSETTANGSNYIALQATAALASNKTITLPDTTGTVVTTGDTGTVTSTMIENGTILNADVNASAAIAGTKISPDFGSQTVATTGIFSSAAGTAAAPSVAFTGDLNTGIYSPGADQVAVSTGGTGRLFVDASGRVGIGASPALPFDVATADDTGVRIRATTNGVDVRVNALGLTGNAGQFGTWSNNPLVFRTNNTERLRIDSSGRVGIGASAPGTLLDTRGFASYRGNAYAIASFCANNTLAPLNIVQSTNGTSPGISAGQDSSTVFQPLVLLTSEVVRQTISTAGTTTLNCNTATSPLQVQINSSEVARIDSSGRVGIGTTGPNRKLEVSDVTTDNFIRVNTTGANKSGIEFASGGAVYGQLYFNNVSPYDLLLLQQYTTGSLILGTNSTERMRITTTGNVNIGISDASGLGSPRLAVASNGTNPTVSLYTNTNASYSQISFLNSNGAVGSIVTTAASTAYNTSSDYRLKENVTPLTGAIDRLNGLQVHRFNFIADADCTVDGFIAHEAQAVVPECVTGVKDAVDDDGNPIYQGIDQSKMVPLLTAALQEAIARIETLEAAVAALQSA